MPSIRAFIALPVAPSVQREMALVQEQLKSAGPEVRWEHPSKFHTTLKFLGDVELASVDALSRALAGAVRPFKSFTVRFETLGAFPDLRRPRIVWIGTNPDPFILDLQRAVEAACAGLGYPAEEHAFHPHITLGRIKAMRPSPRLTEAIKTVTFDPIQAGCPEVVLMKSELKPGGSVYTRIQSYPLLP